MIWSAFLSIFSKGIAENTALTTLVTGEEDVRTT